MDLMSLYARCFPHNIREEATVHRLLSDPDNHVITYYEKDSLIAASVICENTIYLLCVDAAHRRQGHGSRLLRETEEYIRSQGYDSVSIGAGREYIMPGIPMKENAHLFFQKRGYIHSWGDCGCFDMSQELVDFTYGEHVVGDTIRGITYRWAVKADIPRIADCVGETQDSFVQYYLDPEKYEEETPTPVLIVEGDGRVVGALIVSLETEGPGLGSVGCTATAPAYQGRGIATNMVLLGTRYLKDAGLQRAFLGYTYTDILGMYSRAGYRVSMEYFMGRKSLQ